MYTDKNCALSDTVIHTKITVVKSRPSAVPCNFKDFKQEKSDKTKLLFSYYYFTCVSKFRRTFAEN